MAYTQVEIDALKSAIASGALTVKYDDLTTTYRSLDEMTKILGDMEKEFAHMLDCRESKENSQ